MGNQRRRDIEKRQRLGGDADFGARLRGALGANSVILPGVTIGRWALVGVGAVVTHNVPDHGLVLGNPAWLVGYVCRCANRLTVAHAVGVCPACGLEIELLDWQENLC